MTVRVLIAEDQALVRAGLKGIGGTAPDLLVVGEGVGADHLRPGRIRLRRVAWRGEQLPAEGHPAELLAAIRVIAAGEALLGPSITRRVIDEFAARPALREVRPAVRLPAITDREQEVLLLVAEGLSNAGIARRLHIEPGTAKNTSHIS